MGLVPEGQELPRGWRRAVRLAAAASGSPQGRQFARDGMPPGHASRGGGREPAWRHRLSGHFGSAHRNDGPPMLFRLGGQPQPWAIVAAPTTSMGHRCGCPARLNSIDVPSLLLPARVIAADRNPDAPGRRPVRVPFCHLLVAECHRSSVLRGLCCRAASGARAWRPCAPGRLALG